MSANEINIPLLKKFEESLDPENPGGGPVGADVLGYGEISTTLSIGDPSLSGYALKRMPVFRTRGEYESYLEIFNDYHRYLAEAGINIPPYEAVLIETSDNRLVFYNLQKRLEPASICSNIIRKLQKENALLMIGLILRELKKVWEYNAEDNQKNIIGIDGQLSNWAVIGFDPERPEITADTRFWYIDTSTPFITRNGNELLDPELILRSAPSFLVWILKLFFLEDVMTRYYDSGKVVIDLLANLYKEKRPDLIPDGVALAGDFFKGEALKFMKAEITEKAVSSYYREDALIWRLWLFFRKVDRFIKNKILRKKYPFILPEKVER